ncbi:MAG: NAD(P)/FAD-dependent oxidoreductase [Deltaproteobacteria bacterium]|nr:NAD(P)/FAD-dependent oxidoreductase [Deltaproteobacteria bacterium]
MNDDVLNLVVIGGGAAGYFAALRVGAERPAARIVILESNRRPLEKVRISGGGRCNVTHNCFDPATLVQNYPRGHKELRSAFHRFQPQNMLEWLSERGVAIKAEADGRMFPESDDSSTIIDCFEKERIRERVDLRLNSKAEKVAVLPNATFQIEYALKGEGSANNVTLHAENLMLATGNHISGHAFARQLGHTVTPLAPSLFTFNVRDSALQELSGVSVARVHIDLFLEGKRVAESSGPLLITHWGVSGPAVLKLSAWAARELYAAGYRGVLRIHWATEHTRQQVLEQLAAYQGSNPKKTLLRSPQAGLPARLWEYLLRSTLPDLVERPWDQIGKSALQKLVDLLTNYELAFDGKGQFKDEFVTCGGVDLREVDFRSMQSKVVPGLFFAGEILDIDGITGGFNFQSAWTGGWIAGTAIAQRIDDQA